jgi:4'-phosphopantetheinyl transferase
VVGGEAVPVDVWLVPSGPTDDRLLSEDERARASRFRRPADRATYVAAHTALRVLVGDRLGVAPKSVRLGCEDCPLCGGPHGRPTLLGLPDEPAGSGPLQFSLSRTAGLAAVALSSAVVGVDVEAATRPVGLDDLLAALHPRELPVADRTAALRLWVRKEAYLKGRGTGLGLDPATVDLSSDPPGWRILDVPVARPRADATGVRGWVHRDDATVLSALAVLAAGPVRLEVHTATLADLTGRTTRTAAPHPPARTPI